MIITEPVVSYMLMNYPTIQARLQANGAPVAPMLKQLLNGALGERQKPLARASRSCVLYGIAPRPVTCVPSGKRLDTMRGEYIPFPSAQEHAFDCYAHNTDTFHRFYGMQRFIPAGILVKLSLEVIYPSCHIDRGMFFDLLAKALVKESPAEKMEREQYVLDHLRNYIKPNGKVTLYRGATSLNYKPTSAISYTISRERAEWFKNRNQLFGGTDGVVIEKDFPLSKILWYTNCRNEQEVIVESPYLRRLVSQAAIFRKRLLLEEKKLVS